MTAIRRIWRGMWAASSGQRRIAEELRDDPAMADDGLIGFAAIATIVIGLSTFELIPTLIAPLVGPLAALVAAFVLRLVTRISRHPIALAETTATVTLTSLPLLLVPVPVVGPPIAVAGWLLAGIFMLQRVTLARLDVAAVVTLLSHALTVGVLIATGFALEALL